MKGKVFRVLLMLSLLAGLAGSSVVLAQGPLPPQRPVPHPTEASRGFDFVMGRQPPLPPPGTQDIAQAGSEIALGQPGLSFRYVRTFGVPEEGYPADTMHLNKPYGLFVDGSDNLYITEESGHRVLAYDSSGSNTLVMGHASVSWSHDDYLGWPRGVVVRPSDGHIWILISPALKEFDASGNLVQTFPAENPWETGTDNGHFAGDPRGLAMDGSERLYVADANNHRIQVVDLSSGAPVYLETIGVTGVPQDDNTGFDWPSALAFDSAGHLYVLDSANARVQRCTRSSTWSCETFFGHTDEPGSDLTHLEQWAQGITIDGSDNIFIADSKNQRILKCSTLGNCTHFAGTTGVQGSDNAHFTWPIGITTDSGGNVLVSDIDNFRVQKFNSLGVYVSTQGVSGVPYVPDSERLNAPWGVGVGKDGSLFVSENKGYRLVKMNAAGVQQWAVGKAGVWGSANNRFSAWSEGKPAMDASGRIYVSDTGNHRVQIFNPDGTFFARIGVTGVGGSDNAHFSCPTDIAISPAAGDIFVADSCNQRIQVFSSSRTYKATLGTTGVQGSDNRHFRWPQGVAIASNGAIYVADSDNHRVQKCILGASSYSCSTFAGQTGVFDSDFGHLHPLGVAVDAAGRVYAVDEWNNRLQVFDANGAYLTTIGGEWGSSPSDFVDPIGVAVDGSGNVYVTDQATHRIQKFAPGVPKWNQVNLNGFGHRFVEMLPSMVVFNNQLYAGTANYGEGIFHLWRTIDGQVWEEVGQDFQGGISALASFNGQLYAGTWAGGIWSSPDGANWVNVYSGTRGIANLSLYGNTLYAGTYTDAAVEGTTILATTDGVLWSDFVTNGNGDQNATGAISALTFNNNHYFGVGDWTGAQGARVWRYDGTTLAPVVSDGFGNAENQAPGGMASFNGMIFVSVANPNSFQVWASNSGDPGTWSMVFEAGLGEPRSGDQTGLIVFNGFLYLSVQNEYSGMQVWRSADGSTWQKVGDAGFGDGNNRWTAWSNASAVFKNKLYIGVANFANGGEVWRRSPDLVTKKFISTAAQDGWTLELAENSNTGGSANATATTFRLGDEAGDKQYRSILSFNTSLLPPGAVISGVTLKIKSAGAPVGTNPFTTHGALTVDVRKGSFLDNSLLQAGDFQAAASKLAVTTMPKTPLSGWYSRALPATSFGYINRTGVTQFRLRFALDDNEDMSADYMPFHSGNSLTAAYKPVLVITYYVP